MKYILFIFSLILLLSAESRASNSGYWSGIFPHLKINEKNSLSLQAEFRDIGTNEFGLIRPSYHYTLSPHWNIGLGGDLFTQELTETRLWPEINFQYKSETLNQVYFARLRQEFRFLENNSTEGHRTRFMIGTHFKISPKYHLDGFLFNEVFYSERAFDRSGGRFDRNWLGGRVRRYFGMYFLDIGTFWESINNQENSSGWVATFSLGSVY